MTAPDRSRGRDVLGSGRSNLKEIEVSSPQVIEFLMISIIFNFEFNIKKSPI